MTVISQLASALNRKDETPNVDLAQNIAARKDRKAVQELVNHLGNKDKNIQSDCIKVLYEIGVLQPEMIAPYIATLTALLGGKNNRLLWGAMTALDALATTHPKEIYAVLPKILEGADKGSVIARDHAVGVLIKLAGSKPHAKNAMALLLEQFRACPTNQLPMYAENALSVIDGADKKAFISALTDRLHEIEKEPKRKRVEKVINKLNKSNG